MAYGLLCAAYVSLFGGIALLRICSWHGSVGRWPSLDSGACLVLLTASCTIAADSGAFFVGRTLGRHKLAEGISPKKTTEGLVGGMLASLVIGSGIGKSARNPRPLRQPSVHRPRGRADCERVLASPVYPPLPH